MLTDRVLYNYNKNLVPYKEKLAYIQSTGTQYIDTGISGGSNSAFEICLMQNPIQSKVEVLFGGNKTPTGQIKIWVDQTNWNLESNGANKWKIQKSDSGQQIIRITSDGNCYLNDVQQSGTLSTSHNWGSSSFYIFTGHEELNYTCSTRLYYLKMWKDGVLVRDYIPVLDINDDACLYDNVSGTFFYNIGTGTFLYGRL